MKLVAFVAENANAALEQIHRDLGPEAVVVSVRKMPPAGIARLWQRNGRLEVMAGIPQTTPEVQEKPSSRTGTAGAEPNNHVPIETLARRSATGRWRSIAWLESKGLLPAFVDVLEEKIHVLHGKAPLPTPEQEWTAVTNLIICHWRKTEPAMTGTGRPHVFIGPAGSGKTTVLCKWMASAVLLNEQSVRVWRLDGETVNASELLTLHCESLGVPVERFWHRPAEPADLHFVDLPGVEADNPYAMAALRDQLSALPEPHIHLVLNAAYESQILFEQFNAFAPLKPEDIIFTHLDEDRRRVKLWNFVFGINCPISFLSTGQKIPGDFRKAEPALLFPQKNHQ
jgi:flagellar biosynthesis protein FlhF